MNEQGMCCPECGHPHTRVMDTRHWDNPNNGLEETVRYRLCRQCGLRFKTRETVRQETTNLLPIPTKLVVAH